MTVVLRNVFGPARLVAFTWLAGAGLLGTAFMLRIHLVQAHWLGLVVLFWLAPLALYDMQRQEVPHMACVAMPCAAAVVYALSVGAWQLGAVAGLAVAASERHAIRDARKERLIFILALPLACIAALASGEAAPGAIAVLGFWLAYELGWWAGADAIVAITLAILWPDIRWLVALGAAHLGAAICLHMLRWWRVRSAGSSRSPVPGLPVICLAALLYVAWSWS